jgi:hypothetical protein
MKISRLLIAVVILACLTGGLYWSNHHKPAEPSAKITADAAPPILSLRQEDISGVQIKHPGKDDVVLAKNSSGTWEMNAPKQASVDEGSLSTMLSAMSPLNSERLVQDKVADPSQYGFTQPSIEFDITEKGNKSQKLLVGDDVPTGGGSFAMLQGDPRLFTISSSTKASLDQSANALRDKRLITADLNKASRIELIAKKQDIEFGRNKEDWQILKPKPLRADSFQVEDLIRKLKDARMDLTVSAEDNKRAASSFSAGTPVATAKVTGVSGTQELQVRKNKGDYFAKSSAVPGVYKVSTDLGQGLDKNLDDFRNKKLFDFGFEDPSKIEMHDGAKAYFLTKGGEDWWSDGKKMDAATVLSFVGNVRDLSAASFVDSGFTTPNLEIAVTSNENKRIEKVLISHSGDRYIAKRDGEPGLYVLASSSVDEIQKSAAAMKVAAPPPAVSPKAKK